LIKNNENTHSNRISLIIDKFVVNKLYSTLLNCNFAIGRPQKPIQQE